MNPGVQADSLPEDLSQANERASKAESQIAELQARANKLEREKTDALRQVIRALGE